MDETRIKYNKNNGTISQCDISAINHVMDNYKNDYHNLFQKALNIKAPFSSKFSWRNSPSVLNFEFDEIKSSLSKNDPSVIYNHGLHLSL